MTLMDTYINRCAELGHRPRRRRLRRVESRVKEGIRVVLSGIDPEDDEHNSPYVLARIDKHLWYFTKVVDDTIYPLILTTDEVRIIGYI